VPVEINSTGEGGGSLTTGVSWNKGQNSQLRRKDSNTWQLALFNSFSGQRTASVSAL